MTTKSRLFSFYKFLFRKRILSHKQYFARICIEDNIAERCIKEEINRFFNGRKACHSDRNSRRGGRLGAFLVNLDIRFMNCVGHANIAVHHFRQIRAVGKCRFNAQIHHPTGAIRTRLEKERPWNLSALQTLLARLTERGFLSVGKEGRQNVYTPLVDEGEYLAFENAPFLEGRGLPGLVAALYDSRSVSREELAELRVFLDEAMGKEGDV